MSSCSLKYHKLLIFVKNIFTEQNKLKEAIVACPNALALKFEISEQPVACSSLTVVFVSQGLGRAVEFFTLSLQDIDRLIALEPQAVIEPAEKEIAL